MITTKESDIERLQRQLILHSVIYYRLNESIWSDTQYDTASQKLVSIKGTQEFKDSKFYDLFKDFDGSTGYHIALDTPYWISLATRILSYHELH